MENIFLNSKALSPVAEQVKLDLGKIEKLDVSLFSEADVRAEVIDPIVRALGYEKQTYFSLDREKHLKVMNKDLFIDYSMTLMQENFWVIEAKKVKRKALRFTDAEVLQALRYAAHPEINAALVVLCDGRILHVFDREESLIAPILAIEIKNLVRDFDKLRAMLSPWQVWFFEKRRVLRLIDKVFDREPNMNRLQEFRTLVDGRLGMKRSTVLRNYQALASKLNKNENLEYFRKLHYAELIDLHLFLPHSVPEMNAISQRLVEQCHPTSFHVLHGIFPDLPRATNDTFWGSSLHFLLTLESSTQSLNWLPDYLRDAASTTDTANAIKRLIALCLNSFIGDPERRSVQLYANAARRLAKQMLVQQPGSEQSAKMLHAFVRHNVDELSFAQFVASPEGQLGGMLNNLEQSLTQRMVSECKDDRGNFDVAKANQRVKDIWRQERALLGDGVQYRAARQAMDFSDMPWSEGSIAYDHLGHLCLCIIKSFPKWKAYALTEHKPDIQRLTQNGSWQAKEWLVEEHLTLPALSVQNVAERFFLGDAETLLALANGYGIELKVKRDVGSTPRE
jgi:hypothetical protein